MARRRQIYEGKAKILYEGPEPGTLIQYCKDDATAFNAQKKATIEGKGVLNNRLSEHFMTGLNAVGVPTHFIRCTEDRSFTPEFMRRGVADRLSGVAPVELAAGHCAQLSKPQELANLLAGFAN